MEQQMEEQRLRSMPERIRQPIPLLSKEGTDFSLHEKSGVVMIHTYPTQLTPFCFPIKVDSMREDMSSEKLKDRVKKMQARLERQL
ncbi:MAG: hypothetical protein LH478_11760 [Chitinophagaceae bacterium]|nr:hypothetical protein [Chitinophagaceae bacterium]